MKDHSDVTTVAIPGNPFNHPTLNRIVLGLAICAALSLVSLLGQHQTDLAVQDLAAQGMDHGQHGGNVLHMAAAGSGAQAGRPTTVIKPVSCEALPHVPGKSVTTAVVAFPPAGFTPQHRHPGSVTAFVLKGTLRSQLAGGPIVTYTAGQSWFEPPGAIHVFAENASMTEPAELLAIFIADNDCGPLTIPDHTER